MNKYQTAGFSFLGVSSLLLIWYLISSLQVVPTFFLPSPEKVWDAFTDMITSGRLFGDIGISLLRILLGFLTSLIISLPVGIALGVSKKAEAVIEPIVAFIRYVPPSAFIPLTIIWFGIGESGKIFVIFLGVAPYLTLLIADAIHSVPRELLDAARTLGASKMHMISKVILPFTMPIIWDAFRIMFGAAWTFVIIAEIVGSSSGLGHLMIESQRFLRTDTIFACILIIGTLGILTDYLLKVSKKYLFPWAVLQK